MDLQTDPSGFSGVIENLGSFSTWLRDSDSCLKVLSCLATLLRKQDLEAWSYPVTLQVYHGLLSFTVHAKPKVRLLGPLNMGGASHSSRLGCPGCPGGLGRLP